MNKQWFALHQANVIQRPVLIPSSYALSQTTLGRWRLTLYILWKRIAWRLCISYASACKRGIDIFVSTIALILLSPLFLLVAILIKIEDRGPVLFPQIRVGKHGREFRMLKFRSMYVNAERALSELLSQNQHRVGVTFKIRDDPRITRIGKWIRKWSIDELPQLLNVLKGDMSLVGPRPPIPREVKLYNLEERKRLEIAPGITCFWQVSGRSDIPFPAQVQLDLQYIESQSVWLDLKLLCRTIPAVMSGKGAY
jgi:lipopolysaccharide/colanic/teichoic acid biosynthesis glycosyltransferase